MKKVLVLALIGAMLLPVTAWGETQTEEAASENVSEEDIGEAPDYSQESCWYKIPEITREVDTFYIYSTMYAGANEGDSEYAALDNAEVLDGIGIEHAIKSSVFEDVTNLFIPYYRQDDYSIFYNNIKDNAAKRIEAYLAK